MQYFFGRSDIAHGAQDSARAKAGRERESEPGEAFVVDCLNV
jgi:hypothetical protein